MARLGKYYSGDGEFLGELVNDIQHMSLLSPDDFVFPDGKRRILGSAVGSDAPLLLAVARENGLDLWF